MARFASLSGPPSTLVIGANSHAHSIKISAGEEIAVGLGSLSRETPELLEPVDGVDRVRMELTTASPNLTVMRSMFERAKMIGNEKLFVYDSAVLDSLKEMKIRSHRVASDDFFCPLPKKNAPARKQLMDME